MTSKQKYNLYRAFHKLRKDYNNENIHYAIKYEGKSKWDKNSISITINNQLKELILSTSELRTSGGIYKAVIEKTKIAQQTI